MSAPTAIAGGTQPGAGQNREPLEKRLRKLLSPPITKEMEDGLEKIASGVRARLKAASDCDDANRSIGDGLRMIEPGLKHTHRWGEAEKVIGQELGKADGQPVHRIVKPTQKKGAPVSEEPQEDQAASEEFADSASEQPEGPPAVASPVHLGRKMKWDRLDEDSYIEQAVDEAGEYLAARGGEAHPKAPILLSKLINRLGVPMASLAVALRSDRTSSSPDGAARNVADE